MDDMSWKHVVASMALCLAVALLAVCPPASAQSALEGQIAGRMDGTRHPTYAWAWSFAWGFGAGLIGWGGSVLYYATRSPEPSPDRMLALEDKAVEYRLAYLDAYQNAARGKMLIQSAAGGGLGWLTWVAVLSIALASEGPHTYAVPLVRVAW